MTDLLKQPHVERCDEALLDLSEMFFQDVDRPTFGIAFLDPTRLDYSIESLLQVNRYLDAVRSAPRIRDHWNVVVLRCGAYLGEVIRRHCECEAYHWVDFNNARKLDDRLFATYGHRIATSAVLYSPTAGFCFPLAKVEKNLKDGSAEDLPFFVEVLVSRHRTSNRSSDE